MEKQHLTSYSKQHLGQHPKRNRQKGFLFKYQFQVGLIMVVITLCIFSWLYYHAKPGMSVNWLIGILIGIVLDRSRFCFVAAFRDPILNGLARTTKGVIAALMVSTIGFAVIQYQQWYENSYIPGNLYPVGQNIFFGAVIFGIGAVIAGSCASGALMRMGEGFGMQWIVLIGLVLGSLHGIHDAPWWYKHFSSGHQVIHLPSKYGWVKGVGLQIALFIMIYLFIIWYENYRLKGGDN